ncbi:imidazole glycerol phosphate synthase subunit HisF [Tabrizicola sp.]|uniref:imidazole glycerol phosphate synthase subunit HisF n=1 Tax=Tabrizicola sp. TaxID=2005166 RepID=UPI00261348D0|nr:imidazole glycerol phosphate synthase cyclase subunit [Tabrizicola sp.]MDM7932025.1 imidazole glycerol phosphate synthase cyclase subunit [Tabrizicola sp.]
MPARLIARLDIKGPNLIKGVQMEGLRVMGDPCDFARRYYEAGVDELLYIDIVASLYGRSKLTEVVRRTAQDVFVPMTVGGGIRTLDDVTDLLRAGADKVAINTAAVKTPELITQVARRFGSQCMVLSIEAKAMGPGKWEVYTETGREHSGLDVVDWVRRGVDLGAGEVLVTSIDREGGRKGYDTGLIAAISAAVDVPVIASGGYGRTGDLAAALGAGADAVAVADALHYGRKTMADLRAELAGGAA